MLEARHHGRAPGLGRLGLCLLVGWLLLLFGPPLSLVVSLWLGVI